MNEKLNPPTTISMKDVGRDTHSGTQRIPVRIKHNPFTQTTDIFVDGQQVTNGALIELTHHRGESKRLQQWIDRIIPALEEELNTQNFSIEFYGIPEDFCDLLKESALLAETTMITIPVIHQTSPEHRCLTAAQRMTRLKQLFNELKQSPIAEINNPRIIDAFEDAIAPVFEVSVIATMSAGKSTLINAMLGRDLLPSKNEACTATITRIEDWDGMNPFQARILDENDTPVNDWQDATKMLLEQWNENGNTCIVIRGDIPAIRSEETRLILMDTPGPNNSRDSRHSECTISMIKGSQMSIILYILNATQLSTNDDAILLGIVADEMKRSGKQSSDRFVFVLNRVDDFDPDNENVPGLMANAREYLVKKGINNPNILPVSARLGKIIRAHRNGYELSVKETKDLAGDRDFFNDVEPMHLCQYMSNISPDVHEILQRRIEKAQVEGDKSELALLHCGVPAVEEVIQEYLRKYALPAKIYDARTSFISILQNESIQSTLNSRLSQDKRERERINTQLLEVKDKLEDRKEAEEFRTRVRQVDSIPSKRFTQKIGEFQAIFMSQIGKIERDLSEETEMSPESALKRLEAVEQDAQTHYSDLAVNLERVIKEEESGFLEKLIDDYRNYAESLLGECGIDVNTPIASLVVPTYMLDSKTLLKQYEKQVKVKTGSTWVKTSKWWNPFSWGDGYSKDIFENQTIVDMKSLAQQECERLRSQYYGVCKKAEENVNKQLIDIRNQFLKQMDDLDAIIRNLVTELEEKTRSQDALDEVIRHNEAKMAWLNEFLPRLEEVLSVD